MKYVLTMAVLACFSGSALAEGLAKEDVTLTTSDGVTITGYFVKGAAAKGPAVVLLHMLGRTSRDWDPILEKHLLPDTGFSFLAIDLRGHGASTRQGEKALDWKNFSPQDFANAARDVEAAVKWLRARGDVDPDRIGIVGASIGANLALVYAAGDPSVRAVALLSPAVDYHGVKTEQAMKDYGKRPVFVAVSNEDEPAASSVRVLLKLSQADASAGEAVRKVFDGNLHGTRMFAAQPLDKPLADFLNKWLK